MPRATVSKKTQRYDLKSVPEGYVEVRRMTYGEKLTRQDEMVNFEQVEGETKVGVHIGSITLWDFTNLIVSHNLTDENDRPLNFSNVEDVKRLDVQVGEEIGNYIDEFNTFETAPSTAKS